MNQTVKVAKRIPHHVHLYGWNGVMDRIICESCGNTFEVFHKTTCHVCNDCTDRRARLNQDFGGMLGSDRDWVWELASMYHTDRAEYLSIVVMLENTKARQVESPFPAARSG